MSDQIDKPVEGDELAADLESEDVATSDASNTAKPQEVVVEDNTVTIKMSKRAATIGALVLAGFVGFIIGVIGTGAAHHIHDGRDGRDDRGAEHMRMNDFGRQGEQGQFGPGPGMMQGGPLQGYGPDDQRGPGMMPGGPGQIVTATPLPSTN